MLEIILELVLVTEDTTVRIETSANGSVNRETFGTARLVAPSWSISDADLQQAIKNLNALNLDVEYRKDITSQELEFAGSLKRRKEELEWAFSGTNSYIVCARGGWSTIELCKILDFTKLDKEKMFIGYSDITSLHCALQKKCSKVRSVYGGAPIRKDFLENMYLETYHQLFTGKNVELSFEDKLTESQDTQDFQGQIIGGNLNIFCSTLGTPFEVDTEGKVLFFETVDKTPGFIHNSLSQLFAAGKFEGVNGVIFGKMTGAQEYLPFLKKFSQDHISCPVLYELDLGHETNMLPIMIGSIVSFDSKKQKLCFVLR